MQGSYWSCAELMVIEYIRPENVLGRAKRWDEGTTINQPEIPAGDPLNFPPYLSSLGILLETKMRIESPGKWKKDWRVQNPKEGAFVGWKDAPEGAAE